MNFLIKLNKYFSKLPEAYIDQGIGEFSSS